MSIWPGVVSIRIGQTMTTTKVLPQRIGVLEIQKITEDGFAILTCIAHPDEPPLRIKQRDMRNSGLYHCPICAGGKLDIVGQRARDYVAICSLSAGSDSAKHKYLLVFCVFCHEKRMFLQDSFRNGKLPKCKCKTACAG